MAPALSGGGYASEALAFAQGLAPLLKHGFRLRQFAEQPSADFVQGLPESLTKVVAARYQPPTAEQFKGVVVCHSPPDAWKPSKFPGWDELAPCPPRGAAFTIGRTMYETDAMPKDWVARCNSMDSIWVPTSFHQETFRRAGVAAHKLVVLGEPVDTSFFDPAVATPLPLPTRKAKSPPPYRFLSVFKWEQRKGWDVLLSAYFQEFEPSENVELLLKTRPFHSSADFDGLISDFVKRHGLPKRRPPVRVLDQDMSLEDLRSLYAAADAFVLPTRGEGWGRPHVEASAMALPVIATNWSGPATYLDESTGYPVDFELEAVPAELNLPGHRWAEPSVAHLRSLFRHVFEHREEAQRRGRAARERMRERYSPETLASQVMTAVVESQRKVQMHRLGTKQEL